MKDGNVFEKESAVSKMKRNPWIISTIILAIIAIVFVIFFLRGEITGNAVATQESISANFLNFAKSQGVNAEVVNVTDTGSFYELIYSIDGKEGPFYITKDGKYFTQGFIPLTGNAVNNQANQQAEKPAEVTKSDKPKVELFVMTHCPYGTQAEKGFIPVIKALGSKVDANIRFVHYFMHGDKEEKETYNQVCIREEQSAKYLDYLSCFLEDGNSARCLTKAGVDQTKLNVCLSTNKSKEYYAQDSALSQEYGVQGSPTLIINSADVSSGRSPSAMLSSVCSAFNTAPSDCSQSLSTANPSAGFGTVTDTAGHPSTDTQCE